jgi:hypothetical protein
VVVTAKQMRFDFAKHKREGDRPWYLQLVKENLKQVSATDRRGDPRHSYYTYGQDHDRPPGLETLQTAGLWESLGYDRLNKQAINPVRGLD